MPDEKPADEIEEDEAAHRAAEGAGDDKDEFHTISFQTVQFKFRTSNLNSSPYNLNSSPYNLNSSPYNLNCVGYTM